MRRGIALTVVAGLCGAAVADVRDDDKLEADKLFQEGRALLDQGKRADACAKFDLSFRKDPRAVGTILNLGLCAEEAGQVATAVRYYGEARARAHDQGLQEHEQAADGKIALLAPRVPHLAIVLPAGAPPTTRVIVDQIVLAADQLADIPVDPGERAIVVSAPAKLPYETKITVAEGAHPRVVIPALQGARTMVVRPSAKRLWGKILVGSGVALVAGGIGLGLYGRSLYDRQFPNGDPTQPDAEDASHHCFTVMSVRHCDPSGAAKLKTARRVSAAGTAVGIAGVAASVAGAYLWWTSPASITVDVSADHTAVALTAAW
jgi:hypothetical protein